MRPRVIIHNAVSVDGRIDHVPVDLGLFYRLAGTFGEDATLAGSGTILQATAGMEVDDEHPPPASPDTGDHRPLLVIVDSKGKVRAWRRLLEMPFWRGGIALSSRITPPEHLRYLRRMGVECIITGDDQVDLALALEELSQRYGIRIIRVDSGGTLNGTLLRGGLVDEVSVLVHPCLVGGLSPRSIFRAPDLAEGEGAISLLFRHCEHLSDGIIWLRYQVGKGE